LAGLKRLVGAAGEVALLQAAQASRISPTGVASVKVVYDAERVILA
jgi:hypothetical protein